MYKHFRKGVFAFAALLMIAPASWAGSTTFVTVDPAEMNLAFVNVFELPENGGGFQFGGGWGFNDLTANYSGDQLTLGAGAVGGPGTIDCPNDSSGVIFWYQDAPACTVGNKTLEANAYSQVTGALGGTTVQFDFEILSNNLDPGWQVFAFIRDFASNFSSSNDELLEITGMTGIFSLSLDTIPDAARHVQWGFRVVGPNVNRDDIASLGSVVLAPRVIPVPAAVWLMGSGLLGLFGLRRKRA